MGRFASGGPRGLIAGNAVDLLAQDVGVPVVPRVLLDHVQVYPAQVERPAGADLEGLLQRVSLGGLVGQVTFCPECGEIRVRSGGVNLSKSSSGFSSVQYKAPISCPTNRRRNHARSTSAMCLTSPSNDRLDGPTARWLSCSPVSPAPAARAS
jgi:hypothetical protein